MASSATYTLGPNAGPVPSTAGPTAAYRIVEGPGGAA